MFGMANQEYVDMPDYALAQFVGRIFYGIFTLLIVIVLLNMLIAMISIHSRGSRCGSLKDHYKRVKINIREHLWASETEETSGTQKWNRFYLLSLMSKYFK